MYCNNNVYAIKLTDIIIIIFIIIIIVLLLILLLLLLLLPHYNQKFTAVSKLLEIILIYVLYHC